ncbi:protein of unknown function (DUF955) [Promicromonospora umidemergens]|uniref:Helix-turn-helix domain-containing protein n=2 Tax=Promicromonospora TaxID=43676 RepID=A0ABW4VB73_9MICO|nr:XRE family transcriptional regulator [Promicromonospora umidemergens]MCP2286759.1 protein of unknown function (DUF955) [Promicromonospora umidemergens]
MSTSTSRATGLTADLLLHAHGPRLTALRHLHDLTQTDLAGQLGVTQSFLSQVESGARPAPETLVVDASAMFNLPLSFFSVEPDESRTGTVTFRKNSRATARDENRVVEFYNEASRLFRHASIASGYHTARLPDPEDYDHDTERVARAFRQAVGLDDVAPLLNATRALERLGVGVVDNLDHLSDEVRGHTACSRPSPLNDRPLVALAAAVPGGVKRLTLLHEVGHLIFDRGLMNPIKSTRSPEERRAYKFAGACLLPPEVVRSRISEGLTLHGYLAIKAEYGITVGAAVMRARDLGVISEQRARSLQIQISSQGWRTSEPIPVADETPLLLGQALDRAFGKQAAAKASYDVGTKPEWINTWARTANVKAGEHKTAEVLDLASARRNSRRR